MKLTAIVALATILAGPVLAGRGGHVSNIIVMRNTEKQFKIRIKKPPNPKPHKFKGLSKTQLKKLFGR